MNAAAALHVAGRGATLRDALALAEEAVESGGALAKLNDLQRLSQCE
jgi:anthranilate phosphoribosyltransferase